MGRKKAGMCRCGHELRRFHNDEGVCTYGDGTPFARACRAQHGGPCAKPRRKKGKTMNGTMKIATRPVMVNGDAVLAAVDGLIEAVKAQLDALTIIRRELARGKVSKGGTTMSHVLEETRAAPRAPVREQTNRTAAAVVRSDADSYGGAALGMSKMRRTLLTVLAQHPDGMSKRKLLVHAGYSASGKISAEFAALNREGLIDGDSVAIFITKAGLEHLGPFEKLPTGHALRVHVLANKVNTVERALLTVVCDAYPGALSKGEIRDRANYSASGKVSSAFARLKRLGYVTSADRGVRASEDLFG